MANIGSEDIMNLQRKVDRHKSEMSRAEGQKQEVEKSIDTYKKQLLDMGIDPEKAAEFIEAKETELQQQYDKLAAAVKEVDEALLQVQ